MGYFSLNQYSPSEKTLFFRDNIYWLKFTQLDINYESSLKSLIIDKLTLIKKKTLKNFTNRKLWFDTLATPTLPPPYEL